MTDTIEIVERTRRWIEGDPDPATRGELERLLAAGAHDELAERMGAVLEFGTAGIRGAVEAGSNRMNRAVVIRTTAGLAEFLRDRGEGPIVVGFDGRSSSRAFAEDTIGVLVAAGHQVRYFPQPVPTPMVAFTARHLSAVAAVIITASHNPASDNGYKVYDRNAVQIVPPVDGQIADAIARAPAAVDVARVEGVMEGASDLALPLDFDAIYQEYRAQVDGVRTRRRGADLTVAYTPIHGVGWRVFERLIADAGYRSVHVVAEQRDPDGDFPTVAFPNPEEPGAMDLVMALGDEIGADLVIANDPDADRLAVALPEQDGWRLLTGNQIGVLMADWLLEHWTGQEVPLVINSIVSSPMLAEVARLHGARFDQTLTGFKWIANAALDIEEQGGGRFVFGYEEALGYTVGPVVRDKDGLSAALVFMDMAAELSERGETVPDRLNDLYARAGLWVSTQRSILRPGTEGQAEIEDAMERIGQAEPDQVAGRAVIGSTDFRRNAEQRPRWLPATRLVAWDLEGGGRVLMRPSGTEPKLKIYVDLPGEAGTDVARAEAELTGQAEEIAAATAKLIGF